MFRFFFPLIQWLCKRFFDATYLTGRWFDSARVGWKWALQAVIYQKLMRNANRTVPWPVLPSCTIVEHRGIHFHPDNLDNFHNVGCHFEADSEHSITIGHGTYIAPNVHLSVRDSAGAQGSIVLGDHCWLAMNTTVRPGVVLGPHTVVAAGCTVSQSYPDGYCVVGGRPDRVLQHLDPQQFAPVVQQEDDRQPSLGL